MVLHWVYEPCEIMCVPSWKHLIILLQTPHHPIKIQPFFSRPQINIETNPDNCKQFLPLSSWDVTCKVGRSKICAASKCRCQLSISRRNFRCPLLALGQFLPSFSSTTNPLWYHEIRYRKKIEHCNTSLINKMWNYIDFTDSDCTRLNLYPNSKDKLLSQI